MSTYAQCVACTRPAQPVERIVRARFELDICVDSGDCRAHWPKDNHGGGR